MSLGFAFFVGYVLGLISGPVVAVIFPPKTLPTPAKNFSLDKATQFRYTLAPVAAWVRAGALT